MCNAIILPSVCTTTTVRANTDGFIVGNKIETLTGRFRREVGIFMNFGSPSPQTGVVTSWNFHYNCVPRVNRYHATLMMYRLNSANSQYQVLPESIQSISVECLDTGVTLSRNRTLMVEEQFSIEEGDIAAICLPNDDTEPLRIVSMLNPFRNGVRNVLELSINQGEGCSIDRLQTINIQGLRLRRNLQLNFYAEAIAGKRQCT